jgi:hypothetical protein
MGHASPAEGVGQAMDRAKTYPWICREGHEVSGPYFERRPGLCRECEVKRAARYYENERGHYVRWSYDSYVRPWIRMRDGFARDLERAAELAVSIGRTPEDFGIDVTRTLPDRVPWAKERLARYREAEWCFDHDRKRGWLQGLGFGCFDCDPNARWMTKGTEWLTTL